MDPSPDVPPLTDRDIKPANLIDHQGVETGCEKPPAPRPWNPPGYQPPLRAGTNRKPRRPR